MSRDPHMSWRPQDLRAPGSLVCHASMEALRDHDGSRRFWKQHSQWAADPEQSFPSRLVPRTRLPPAERPGGHTKGCHLLRVRCLASNCPEDLSGGSAPSVFSTPDPLGAPSLPPSGHRGTFHHSSCQCQSQSRVVPSALPPACSPPRLPGQPHVPSDLTLDLPGLGDGGQVAGRHHHGPVSRGSWRQLHAAPPPCPRPHTAVSQRLAGTWLVRTCSLTGPLGFPGNT